MVLKILGGGLMLLGFLLTPIIIGVPIMMVGWLLALFGFLIQLTNLVPEKQRETITTLMKESYTEYRGATKSLAAAGKEMLKIALIVFVFMLIGAGAITKKMGWW